MKKLLLLLTFIFICNLSFSQVIQRDTIDRKIDLKLHKKVNTQVSAGVLTSVVGFAVMMSNFDITNKYKPTYIAGCAITGIGITVLFTAPLRILKKKIRL